MILRQFLRSDPIAASYPFGCASHAAAAVVAPWGDIAPCLATADKTGVRIRCVIDTHLHADRISSGRELAKVTSAEYVLFAAFPFRGVRDGEVLELGNVSNPSC